MICLLSYMPVIIQYKETPKSLHLPPWAGSSLAACAGRRGCLGTSLFPHLCFSSFPSCLFASVSDPSRFETGKRRNSNRQEKPYFWLRCCAHQVSVLSRLGRESRADSLMSCFCGSMAAPRVESIPIALARSLPASHIQVYPKFPASGNQLHTFSEGVPLPFQGSL